MTGTFIFDQPIARDFVEARQAFLQKILPPMKAALDLRNAIDVGCGVGYFSEFLREMGFAVTAVDGRDENITEANLRHADINFQVRNVEDLRIRELGSFDLVLCFGLLYHLEHPMLAFRNLHPLTNKLLLIESACVPQRGIDLLHA
jgi:2-polyprenyl-3-methyl-5-hydroxy-6-metoxy-1,4-benzoquinol methylase